MNKQDILLKVASGDPVIDVLGQMCKIAKTVNDVKAEQMKKMHVGSSSIKNYADQRDANMPAWYNPIDWLMNWKRYVRNDLQFEKNREMLMNRSNDRYWKQMDQLRQRQATPPQGK